MLWLKIFMGIIVVALLCGTLVGWVRVHESKKEKEKDEQKGGKSYNKGAWIVTFLFVLSLVGLYLVLKYH
jgi:hypothetical protein